jgi:hypothetical protein
MLHVVKGSALGGFIAGAVVATAIAGCSSDESVTLGSVHVKSAEITAEGGSIVVESNDAPNRPDLVGVRIDIPAGALDQKTKITIDVDPQDLTLDETDASGAVIQFGPDGTRFNTPAKITLPYPAEYDEDLVRVVVREADGTTRILFAGDLTYDAGAKTVSFPTEHFTRFQGRRSRHACANVNCPNGRCHRGQCEQPPSPCDAQDACGPAPGVPTWMCEDGTVGGSTGRCVEQQDGSCGWEIRWCPRQCDANECGPQPGQPNYMCPDGTVAGPTECTRRADGTCGWDFVQCPPADCTNVMCPQGTTCNPMIGRCEPTQGETCGNTVCGTDQYCCNPSCGQCARQGEGCTQQQCDTCANGTACPPGTACNAMTGQCEQQPNTCDPMRCGPRPGTPSWTCEDGTAGGFTGNCLPQADGSCAWEIIWCPRACDETECQNAAGMRPANCNGTCTRDMNGACTWTCVQECDPTECGPRLGQPNYQCMDGMTIAGPTGRCLRNADQTCSWEVISCPP